MPIGLERIALPSIAGEAIFYEVENLARRGTNRVLALILDANVEIVPHHFSEVGLTSPTSIDVWGEQLDHTLLLNAGLFDANNCPLGLAKHRGTFHSSKEHPSWQGMLIGDAPSHIADLRFETPETRRVASNSLQSMMLVDRKGALRVRSSSLSACRTVIGEDAQGRLVIVLTEGAVSLAALGEWLRDGPLQLTQALNLDGGHESQLLLRTPELELCLIGQHGVNVSGGPTRPLPVVLALRRSETNK